MVSCFSYMYHVKYKGVYLYLYYLSSVREIYEKCEYKILTILDSI